jgi:hypothetical protein
MSAKELSGLMNTIVTHLFEARHRRVLFRHRVPS